jgi:hypothetical protein
MIIVGFLVALAIRESIRLKILSIIARYLNVPAADKAIWSSFC